MHVRMTHDSHDKLSIICPLHSKHRVDDTQTGHVDAIL